MLWPDSACCKPCLCAAVRQQGNLLLCTLLLGNTVINSAISILLADLTTGFIGLLVATFVILIFGTLHCSLQAVWPPCSDADRRNALQVKLYHSLYAHRRKWGSRLAPTRYGWSRPSCEQQSVFVTASTQPAAGEAQLPALSPSWVAAPVSWAFHDNVNANQLLIAAADSGAYTTRMMHAG